MKNCIIIIALLMAGTTFAQFPPNTYQTKENPHYWKNRPPRVDYWQQDVHYIMEVELDDSANTISCPKYQLTYWNNSPDDLNELYFHLYQNAFQPGSYMHNLYQNNGKKISFGDYEKQGFGTVVKDVSVNGVAIEPQLDNTIMRLALAQPIKSGEKASIQLDFTTYFDKGTFRRRMKMFESDGGSHYDAVHWYPSMAVYDEKFGWTTEQHLDKEFYADFGTFDVSVQLPTNYIMDATGVLQNRKEVLPTALRDSIDLARFKVKGKNSYTIPRVNGKSKTWVYHAENVHNFAFTCDPKYRIGEIPWGENKTVVTLARENRAHGWQPSGNYAKQVVEIYSKDFGQYAWPKIIIADAEDGMEYPMLTLDGGSYPRHQGLLAHEIGHMWFYGMIGSNETYRAMMDEGFTQFLTVWSMDKILGEEIDYKDRITPNSKHKYTLKHLYPKRTRYERLYYPYLKQVHEGYDHQLNTHSSDFNGAVRHGGGYGLVYYKTGVMLYNLRYVLGEDLFLEAMKYYFDKWKIAHPYPEDFRQSIVEYTKVDLNWFFDQWMETTKHIDYSLEKVSSGENPNEYKIKFKRLGEMQMPIDFSVYTEDGKEHKFHIPNTWFVKSTDALVLGKWYGWGNVNPTYTATVSIDGKIDNVVIDPDKYLADINLTNNQWNGAYQFQFDHRVRNYPNWRKAENFYRPDIWYNGYDGLQIGAHIEGNYFKQTNFYKATAWFNTGLGQINTTDNVKDDFRRLSVHLYSREKLRSVWRNLSLEEELKINAGLFLGRIGLSKLFKKRDLYASEYTRVDIGMKFMNRPSTTDLEYLLYNEQWSTDAFNNSFNVSVERRFDLNKTIGIWNTDLRTPGLFSEFNYSYLRSQLKLQHSLKFLGLKGRAFAQLGSGSMPGESQLYLSGANPEEMYDSKFTRARGLFPSAWEGYGVETSHLHAGGGLNLRGFSGYLAPDGTTTGDSLTFSGQSGVALNIEIDFKNGKPAKRGKKLLFHPYVFTDLGMIQFRNANNEIAFGKLRMDAGIGSATTIKFGNLNIKPLVIRVDLPVFLNRPPASDGQYWKLRSVIGIERAF